MYDVNINKKYGLIIKVIKSCKILHNKRPKPKFYKKWAWTFLLF